MTASLYDFSIGTYKRILKATAGFMAKAREHFNSDESELQNIVETRLHPDMMPFHFQIVSIVHHSNGAIKGVAAGEFSPPSFDIDKSFDELENLVKRFVVLGSEESLVQELEARSAEPRAPRPSGSTDLDRYLAGEVDRISLKKLGREAARAAEKRLIEKTLHRTRWNRREAAEILKISYKALLYKMKDAGLADSA